MLANYLHGTYHITGLLAPHRHTNPTGHWACLYRPKAVLQAKDMLVPETFT